MSNLDLTLEDDDRSQVQIRTLAVEVIEGPDHGARAEADSETLTIGTAKGNDLRLTDDRVSRYHLELRRSAGGVLLEDLSSTNGTRVSGIRIMRAEIPPGARIEIGRSAILVTDGGSRLVEVDTSDRFGNLIGSSSAMRSLFTKVRRAGESEVPVLLLGETGTGKELVARALHEASKRRHRKLEIVDCGALMPTLIANELFGHERGAFTGADAPATGAFERAHEGTLFLDEIGELPLEMQAALLGVLERKRFKRLGGAVEIPADVRIVAATHRDLRAAVNAGRFREDLFYRLGVVVLRIPPLRERSEDIPLLVRHFLAEAGHRGRVEEVFDPKTLAELELHHWPGNVRELRNYVAAALAMGEPPEFTQRAPLPETLLSREVIAGLLTLSYAEAKGRVTDEFEQLYLKGLLARCKKNVSKAAREAQMDRSHLRTLIAKHHLED